MSVQEDQQSSPTIMSDAMVETQPSRPTATATAISPLDSNRKRPAQEKSPQYSRIIAAQKFFEAPPKEPKKITPYARFKIVLTKVYKAKGSKLTAPGAKSAWEVAQTETIPLGDADSGKENAGYSETLQAKLDAERLQKEEAANYAAALGVWSHQKNEAAAAYFHYLLTEQSIEGVQEALASDAAKAEPWCKQVPCTFLSILKNAKTELSGWVRDKEEADLLAYLQAASPENLQAHVKDFMQAKNKAAKYDMVQQKIAANRAAKEKEQAEAAEKLTVTLKKCILSHMKQRMVYVKGMGKFGQERIEVRFEDDCPPHVFEKVFEVPKGQRSATLPGDLIPVKQLRYGGCLCMNSIAVRLDAKNNVIASGIYGCY